MPNKPWSIETCLKSVLALLLFLIPIHTVWIYQEQYILDSKWEYGTLNFFLSEGVVWGAVFLCLVWYNQKRKARAQKIFHWTNDRIFTLSILIFLIYLLLSSVFLGNRELAFQQTFRVLEAALVFFIVLIGPLSLRQSISWLSLGATGQALLAVWQFLTQSTLVSTILGASRHPAWQAGSAIVASPELGRWIRAYGLFPHPNMLGGYLLFSLILTSLLFIHTEYNPLSRRLLLGSVIIQAAGLFFTFSRSAWLGLVLFWLLCFLGKAMLLSTQKKHIRTAIIPQILVSALLAVIFLPVVLVRFSSQPPHEVASIGERAAGYREALSLSTHHPLFGVGAGNNTVAAMRVTPNQPGWFYQPIHNIPLLLLVELGLVGIGLIFFVVISFVRFILASAGPRGLLQLVCFSSPILPPLLLDHYFWSSWTSLLTLSVFVALLLKFVPHLSTDHPQAYPRLVHFLAK